MYNKVFLIGNLTRDPEMRYTPSGIPVVRFAIAVGRPKSKDADADTSADVDFINIVAWRRLAEICAEYLKKGRPVEIEGRLQIRSYDKNGESIMISEVVADNMQMLGRKPDENIPAVVQETAPEQTTADEIPF